MNARDKELVMEQIIHASDISNPIKTLAVYAQWVDRVLEEFWNQVLLYYYNAILGIMNFKIKL